MNTTGTASRTTPEASENTKHPEGPIARTIEEQTSKLPSDLFLWGALGSMGISLLLETIGKKEKSHFIGQWVAPFLLFGLYNKLVKVAGSDRVTSDEKEKKKN